MGLRICLVTPFSWSQPHEVNEHVRGVGDELRRLGHDVTVIAPSGRAADLLAGRRALARGLDGTAQSGALGEPDELVARQFGQVDVPTRVGGEPVTF